MLAEQSIATESTDELTLEEVRNRLNDLIHRGFESPDTSLIKALPVSGKSYGSIKWAAQTGQLLTVFAPRHELLNEYKDYCEEFGLTYKRIPSFYRDCASFEKNSDEEYEPIDGAAKELQRDYNRGFNGVTLHNHHPNTPCQADGDCPFISKRDDDPSEYDVLLGTYRHAYPEKWIKGRYVAFDEFPEDAFLKTFDDGIEPIVSAYLDDYEDQLPFRDYRDFLGRMASPDVQDHIETWKENPSWTYDYGHVRRSPNPSAHALAPMAILALIEEERLDNNWGYSDLGYGRVAVCNPKKNKWTFHLPPDLSCAESVVALDGTPNETLWQVVLNEQIQSLSLLDDEERETYLQDVLGYRFVQTTDAWKPIQGKKGASPPKDLALIEGICQTEGEELALISSQKAIRQYRTEGLSELTEAETVEHYCNLKGMNDFGKERLGLVLGCPFPEDDLIEKWAALAGESAERKDDPNGEPLRGPRTDFGPFGNEVMHTLVHDEVLQAAMRFGREKENGVRGATVYLHTSAIPPWFPVEKRIPNIHSWIRGDKGMRKTVEAITQIDSWQDSVWKTTDVYPLIPEFCRRTIRYRLDDLVEEGYIHFEGKQGKIKCYTNICLEDAGSFGHVEFPE
ncbi:hypothetical protein [Haloplanus rubicundus]|uniref:hypothetical protein n=1 Tax=Haloplanus rubicundus TaxID=1547898 RepID=UPI0013008061|nr:hypothetical protein [Haloplanus rubicundus]